MERQKDLETKARKPSWTWKEGTDWNWGGSWGHSGLSERKISYDDKIYSGRDFANEIFPFPEPQEDDELEMVAHYRLFYSKRFSSFTLWKSRTSIC